MPCFLIQVPYNSLHFLNLLFQCTGLVYTQHNPLFYSCWSLHLNLLMFVILTSTFLMCAFQNSIFNIFLLFTLHYSQRRSRFVLTTFFFLQGLPLLLDLLSVIHKTKYLSVERGYYFVVELFLVQIVT